ncbi:OBAP family protein [Geomonas sp. RF6]|uniref:OBAP family protein n=1 Tax=Geomonas sp. RF6 TaxID=2897342 RepID=UPI001E53BF94|nr:OBAP family protein [Geomonas sp. RF6]UFS70157.1 OBAP family protein [Geomonas sp. RF6]
MQRRHTLRLAIILLLATLTPAHAEPGKQIPGAEKTTRTKALEAGAKLIQERSPLKAMSMYLNGFHFHSGDMTHQMTAYHYCSGLSEELTQCVLYDGNDKNSRLIGIEYIVSERLFGTLPEEERKLWHSHRYEVKSGTLVAPGIPLAVEHQLMEKIVSTYGKTWHTWESAYDPLPLGIPILMMGFTADGQMKPQVMQERDRLLKVDSAEHKKNRADIPTPKPVPGADAWQNGPAPQVTLTEGRRKRTGDLVVPARKVEAGK